jgi:hypothetical protein
MNFQKESSINANSSPLLRPLESDMIVGNFIS